MSEPTVNPLEYYASPGPMTDPKEYAVLLDGLPTDMAALCQAVQGLLIHIIWAERYGVTLSEERKQEVELRAVPRMLARIRELDDLPLIVARPLERRLVGTCRSFSTLLCAILRRQGVPVRARCGFAAYLAPNKYVDHWVCEYWQADDRRWVMADASLDQFQRQKLNIQFDPLDMPRDQFLTGGKAWQVCRQGLADPDLFGILDTRGMRFVRSNVVRDLASLNKIEMLPWDEWGLISKGEADLSDVDRTFLDHIAAMTLAGDEAFSEIRFIYETDARVRVPSVDPKDLAIDAAGLP